MSAFTGTGETMSVKRAAQPPGGAGRRVAAPGAALRYWPRLLDGPEADRLLDRLLAELDWRQHEVRIAGRRFPSPRLSAWYGDPGTTYRYSGLALTAAGWPPVLAPVRAAVEDAARTRFNSVLANLYRDGADSMGWHSDDEGELGPEPVIASVSLGAERRFVLRHRRDRSVPAVSLTLEHGSLLTMAGATQRNWRHALPKARRVSRPRVNLTFRCVSPQGERR